MAPTKNQLNTFHLKDRTLFSKLVFSFSKSPAESLLVMATWFWLEDFLAQNILSDIIELSDPVVAALTNEAVLCFQCLEIPEKPKYFNQIPLTAKLLKNNFSLQTLYQNRFQAITGIKNFLNTVCSRIFSDIIQHVLPSSSSSSSSSSRLDHPLFIPGFPHPTFGDINVMPVVVVGDINVILDDNNLLSSSHGLWGWNANRVANDTERTMFITFSRGFPVSQEEVKDFFTRNFGENCVESIHMQEDDNRNMNHRQSLFATMVMDSVVTVDRILNGENQQKFKSNGKDIWARKYNINRDG